jgi:uncharacterized repeat protein (TIGR03803 family)
MRLARILLLLSSLGAPALVRAEITPAVVHSFDGTDGQQPRGALVDGGDGFLYGTTVFGGTGVLSPAGTVYRITQAGDLTTLYTFEFQITGDGPVAGVLRLADGTLFGTTRGSGAFNGNVFRLDTGGFTGLHNFTGYFVGADGGHPEGALVEGGNGNLYGTTTDGGTSNIGTIYQIDALGDYTLVHSFTPAAQDGIAPRPLVLADDGNLYGATASGGTESGGTVFRFTPGGSGVTTLHAFPGSVGTGPTTLVKGLDGALYGTTAAGGTFGVGTVFRITTSGDFESLHSFTLVSGEASYPTGLTVGSDGNLYGTSGGGVGIGAVFRVRPDNGAFTTLFAFPLPGSSGSSPQGALAQLGDKLYGTTNQGGAGGKGTVFRIDGLTIAAPEPEAAAGEAVAALCLGLVVARRQREASR